MPTVINPSSQPMTRQTHFGFLFSDSPAAVGGRASPVLLLVLCLWFLVPLARAADISITPQQLPLELGQYLDYLEDPDRTLEIEALAADPGGFPWVRNTRSIPTLGVSNSAHWFRLRLSLTDFTGTSQTLVMVIRSPVIDNIQVFMLQDGRIVQQEQTGDTIPMSRVSLPLRVPTVPLTGLDMDRSVDVYFRVTSSSGVEFPLSITSLDRLLVQQQWTIAYSGALFTFLTICLVVCSMVYFYLKERVFMVAALFFLAGYLFFLGLTGMGRVWLWPESSSLNTRVIFFAGTVLIMSFCLIGRSFDLRFRYQDSINLILKVLAFSMVPAGIYYLTLPMDKLTSETVLPLMWLGLIVSLVAIFMAVMAAIKGSRTALYMSGAWALMLISYLLTLLYKLGITQRSDFIMTLGYGVFLASMLLLLLTLSEFIRSKARELQSVRHEAYARTDFLRKVSREILTPVHLVLANAKRLFVLDQALPDTARPQLHSIIKQSNYLHQLINDLLEMAELESDSFELQLELVEMTRFLTQIRDMMNRQAQDKGLTLNTNFSSASLLLQTDKSRLQHAILNLTANAIKYTSSGTVTLGYKAIYFHRRLGIEISVKDTGQGMSEEFKAQLFEEFAREKPAEQANPEGTGLRLTIVTRMVEKLGGEISFESSIKERNS